MDVFNLGPFASNLSYIYMSGSITLWGTRQNISIYSNQNDISFYLLEPKLNSKFTTTKISYGQSLYDKSLEFTKMLNPAFDISYKKEVNLNLKWPICSEDSLTGNKTHCLSRYFIYFC